MRSLSVTSLSLLLLQACYSPHAVQGPEGKKMEGVPFFLKVAQYTRTTDYEARWLEVTLRVKRDAKEPSVELTRRIPLSERDKANALAATIKGKAREALVSQNDALSNLIDQFKAQDNSKDAAAAELAVLRQEALAAQRSTVENSWNAIKEAFDALPEIRNFEAELANKDSVELPKRRVANRIEYTPFVDYSKTYTYNVDLPFFAKADSVVELNADLLMTKATANVDQAGIATGLSALLPLKEFLSEKLLDPVVADAAQTLLAPGFAAEPVAPFLIELAVAETGLRFSFQKKASKEDDLGTHLAFCLDTNFSTQPLDGGPKKEPEDPKVKKAGFALSGEVKLPK